MVATAEVVITEAVLGETVTSIIASPIIFFSRTVLTYISFIKISAVPLKITNISVAGSPYFIMNSPFLKCLSFVRFDNAYSWNRGYVLKNSSWCKNSPIIRKSPSDLCFLFTQNATLWSSFISTNALKSGFSKSHSGNIVYILGYLCTVNDLSFDLSNFLSL